MQSQYKSRTPQEDCWLKCGCKGYVLWANLIVVRQLLSCMYMMLGVDDNVLVTLHRNDFGVAVGVTAVVDEARKSTLKSTPKIQLSIT